MAADHAEMKIFSTLMLGEWKYAEQCFISCNLRNWMLFQFTYNVEAPAAV